MEAKRIAVVVTARPSWAKLESICAALRERGADVQIIACASALLERYGRVVDEIRAQGYEIAAECWTTHEGSNLVTSAKETGSLLSDVADVLRVLSPRCVLVCADRHEVLGAAQAGAYLHIPVAHLQGGERTGSIDDRVRDAVTAVSDYHFPATEQAKYRVYSLTGAWDRIWNYGCPSIDIARRALEAPAVTSEELGGTGQSFDLSRPFVVVLQHPVTNEADQAAAQMQQTLEAVRRIPLPRVIFWPGQDAGSDAMAKVIRQWVIAHPNEVVRTVRSLAPERFLRLLTQASALIGNSSAGIRECAYLGVPVVNVGTRQFGRERAKNVADVPHDAGKIMWAFNAHTYITKATQRYPSDTRYGDGAAGPRIAEKLMEMCL